MAGRIETLEGDPIMLLKRNYTDYIFIFLSIFWATVSCSPSSSKATAQQSEAVQNEAYPAPFKLTVESDIQRYEELLNHNDLGAEDRLPVESLLAEAREVATMIAASPPSTEQIEADLADHETRVAEEKLEPTSTPELGILESGIFFEAHVPRRVKIENIWQGYVDGHLTRIYAGLLLPDYRVSTSVEKGETQFGAIYVMTFYPDGKVETHLYATDKETGTLRVQEANEEFLILDSAGTKELAGQVNYYGLKIHRLVDSLDEFNARHQPQ
jgi:hypothetical protein